MTSNQDAPAAFDDALLRIRHSLAHVLAQAVLELRPGSTLGFGPAIDDGFYYDFVLSAPLSEDDFADIERIMRRILKEGQLFEQETLEREAALVRLDDMNEPYKREYAQELFETRDLKDLSFYRNGPFVDMCEGPHVRSTREIPADAFRLRSLAGAYWRGDSDNVMMTRIYAWAFSDRETLETHVRAYEEAQAKDHKRLGPALDLYDFDPAVGRGLPLWLPNGTVVRDELEKLARELEFRGGYQRVATPHIARTDLYRTSGHLPYYADDMFPGMHVQETDAEEPRDSYVLRPMNCPHHHRIFAARPRSYRDLPLRLAEYGQCYRWESSGAVSGLLRTRGFCMNDAHIYCTEDQVREEIRQVILLYQEVYRTLGLVDFDVRLSRWDPRRTDKYVNDPAAWARCEALLADVLRELQLDYVDGPGEAAFYGPKIDIQFHTVTGRSETVSTVQLDFAQPARMGLSYVGDDGAEHVPYCIHRAPLSTHERMVAFLLEHYGGALPTWLAPVQVRVITVSDQFDDYGREIVGRLREKFVRADMPRHSDTVSKKIREAAAEKVPNLLIVGAREQAGRMVTWRRHGDAAQSEIPLGDFEAQILDAIEKRRQTS
ncbi:MAG: threonine--tRNA ligase [Pseudomonadales bacterium]|jgi:threonyl-tRNA synthetase